MLVRLTTALSHPVTDYFLSLGLSPPCDLWCGVLGFEPTGSVSSSSTLQIYWDAHHSVCSVIYVDSTMSSTVQPQDVAEQQQQWTDQRIQCGRHPVGHHPQVQKEGKERPKQHQPHLADGPETHSKILVMHATPPPVALKHTPRYWLCMQHLHQWPWNAHQDTGYVCNTSISGPETHTKILVMYKTPLPMALKQAPSYQSRM